MITYQIGMPNSQEVRTVGVVPPITPVQGVYYDLETNKLYTRPVVGFVLREFINKSKNPVETCVKAFPIAFSTVVDQMIEEDTFGGAQGFLGLSDVAEAKKESWQNEIRDLKKKAKITE